MANSNDFNSTVSTLFKGMDAFLTSKSVVGEPIQVGDTTIIPMCDVNFGVGAGAYGGNRGSNSAGGGMGGKLSPSSCIVIKDGYAQVLNLNAEPNTLSKIIDMIPIVADKVKQTLEDKNITADEMDEIKNITEEMDTKAIEIEE